MLTADEFRQRVATFRPQAQRSIHWMSILCGAVIGLTAITLRWAGLISDFGAVAVFLSGALIGAGAMWWYVGRLGQKVGITCPDCGRRLVTVDARWDAAVLETGCCRHCGAAVISGITEAEPGPAAAAPEPQEALYQDQASKATIDQPPRQRPWYNPSLPIWFPGWLVACVAVGVSTAGTFSYAFDRLGWGDLALLFGMGFGITLLILTFGHERAHRFNASPETQYPGIFPPFWVRHTVNVAFGMGVGIGLVSGEMLKARPWNRVIAEEVAVVVGALFMAGSAYSSWRVLVRKPAPSAGTCIGLVGLSIVAAGLVFAVYLALAAG